MKTGEELWNRALRLLHYADIRRMDGGEETALAIINQVASDLWYGTREGDFSPLSELSDPLPLTGRLVEDVMPYGVAMLLSQNLGDADSQALFASLYNQKRARMRGGESRLDVMPRGGM